MFQLPTFHIQLLLQNVRHPLRFLNFLGLKLAYTFNWKRNPFMPVGIDVEPNNTCNFKCPHCQVTHWDKERQYLDLPHFLSIIRQIPHLVYVRLQGMGEPLMNPQLIPMLKAGESQGLSMVFNSNGSLCTQKTANELAQLKRTTIRFSLDGGTAETFERVRPGSRFESIKANLRYLTQQRSKGKGPNITGWTVLTHENLEELPQITELAHEVGLDGLGVQLSLSSWGKEDLDRYNQTIRLDQAKDPQVDDKLTQSKEIADRYGMAFDTHELNYTKQRKCPWPWERAYITAGGDVTPCCFISDPDTMNMGNVFEQDFSEIWNSEQYQAFRDRLARHDLPTFCKGCYADAE